MNQTQKHFHFMGISGIGVSGIAKILKQQGHIISGCDRSIDSKHIKELSALKCNISSTHQSDICNDPTIDTLVFTSAISKNHPEILQAQKNEVRCLLRAEALAEIMAKQTSIAIAGSHGKTSTSSLMGHLLLYANQDPSIIVGGHINSINSNAQYGKGKYLVAEADESDRSLLKLPKKYTIITNVNLEHLETYTDFDDVKKTFTTFINSTPQNGHNVICIDSQGVQDILPTITTPYSTYGQSELADIQPINITLNTESSTFDIYHKKSNNILGTITLPQAGLHYVINATGAIALALHLNIPFPNIQKALSTFTGVDRRFSFKGIAKTNRALIFDDYGHHPIEIINALTIARKKASKKLIVVFQPHRFSRTKHLWSQFIDTFANSMIDTIIITDIYAASEQPIDAVSSKNLVEAIKQKNPKKSVFYCPIDPELEHIYNLVNKISSKDDLLLLLGAGKVNKLAEKLI